MHDSVGARDDSGGNEMLLSPGSRRKLLNFRPGLVHDSFTNVSTRWTFGIRNVAPTITLDTKATPQ